MKNIISIIVIIISIATFVFIVKPGYMEIKDIESKSNNLEEVLANAKKLQSLRDNLLEKKKKLSRADLDRLEKLIPENADNVKLIMNLQDIAKTYGLTMETASSDKKDKDKKGKGGKQTFDIETKDYGIISLDFNISGSYDGFISFIKDIEDNLRITDIKNLSIEGTDDAKKFNFALKVDTYWLKDNI